MPDIRTKPVTKAYEEGWEQAFGKKKPECEFDTPEGCVATICNVDDTCGSRKKDGTPNKKLI